MRLILLKLIYIIIVLLRVAFITLIERKILGYVQYRKGPNKVLIIGLFQPISDAVKLFEKEKINLIRRNNILYIFSVILSLILILIFWMLIFLKNIKGIITNIEFIFFIMISGLSAYVIVFSGWSSNSKYRELGAYRGVAQIISYEVSLIFLLIRVLIIIESIRFLKLIEIQNKFVILILNNLIILFLWIFIILAETNRTPYDFAEGESELVSGFNVEYGGVLFAMLFIAEYGNIIFISYLTRMIFIWRRNLIISIIFIIVIRFLLIIRGTYVRFRYDLLIIFAWKVVLPFVIIYFLLELVILLI